MKFFTALVALTAFVAAHDGPHDAQGNALPSSQPANSNGSQNQNKEYPLPPSQGGNNSSGSQNGNQGQQPYPTPIPSQQGGNNQPSMEEFQKFMQSPMMQKFMEYMKSKQQTKQ